MQFNVKGFANNKDVWYEIGIKPSQDIDGNIVYKITHNFVNPKKYEIQ